MRSIVTLTPLVSPHFFAHPSRYVSKSGTKWLHWRMFRLPLSFGRVPTPVGAADPLGADDGVGLLPACCPTHEARTGTAAAATAPLRSVRRLMPSVASAYSLPLSGETASPRNAAPGAKVARRERSVVSMR